MPRQHSTAHRATQAPLAFHAPATNTAEEDRTVYQALAILRRRMSESGIDLSGPHAVRRFLWLQLALEPRELFAVLWTDAQNRLIEAEVAFAGTLTQTSVHPREIVKSGLRHNAAGVILAHNHPSGSPEPSRADIALTAALKTALVLVDIEVLDHFVVAGEHALSFAERGLL
jgi:DNA repair protein RadC